MQNNNFRAWLIWSIAGIYVLYQFLLQASTSVMIPYLMDAFHIDVEQVGLLSSSFFYTYILLQIPSGLLVDRLGVRKLLPIAILLCAVAAFLFGYADHFYAAELSRLLMGIVTAPAVVAALYLASNWLPSNKFALAVGLTEALGMLGGAVGEEFLAHCVENIGWRGTMYTCAAFAVVLAIVAYVFIRDRPVGTADKAQASLVENELSILRSLKQIIAMPQAWFNGLYAGLMFVIIQAFASLWAVPFLQKYYSATLDWAAGLSAMIFLGTAVGAPFMGWLSDKIGRRKPVMLSGVVLSLLLLLVILYVPAIPMSLMFGLLFLLGFVCGSYVIPFAIMREIIQPQIRGAALGYINMMTIAIGAPILQPIIGYLLKINSDDYQRALWVLPVAILLALLMALFIRETYCREEVAHSF